MSKDSVASIIQKLASMPIAKRRLVPGLQRGREDVILTGGTIVLEAMAAGGFAEIVVTEGGLLEGALMKAADNCA